MIEIKTLTSFDTTRFDNMVNDALKDGWELAKRECLITDNLPLLYAELERVIEEPEEEEEDNSIETAQWGLSRNPHMPYRCSACAFTSNAPYPTCPKCNRIMVRSEK